MQFFTAIFILVAIITADDNEKSDGGFRVVGFTGIWTAFMMTAIMSVAAQVCWVLWRSVMWCCILYWSLLWFYRVTWLMLDYDVDVI